MTRQALEHALTRLWQATPPTAAARALQPLSWLYGALSAAHRGLYAAGVFAAQHAPVPVVVVGNLVAGGAGKTPTVLALVPLLQAMGHRPGVISRGHGRQGDGVLAVHHNSDAAEVGDEPLLIHRRSGVPVQVGRSRHAAALALCANHPKVTVLVADDGLQHHRLARDLDLLLFDDRGAGNGLLLPAGPLRQSMPATLPPHSLVLYTGGVRSTALPGFVGQRRLTGVLALADWWARGQHMALLPLKCLMDRPLLAAAGLARPETFFAMLEAEGLAIRRLPLPDHGSFTPLPWPADTSDVVVTEKDAVKLRPDAMGSTRVWVAQLDFCIETGFADALRSLCPPPPAPPDGRPTCTPPLPAP